MRYRWRDIPYLLNTPIGRLQFLHGINYRAWPLLSVSAAIYRRMFVKSSRVIAVIGSFGKSTTARAVLTGLGQRPTDALCLNEWSYVAKAILRTRRKDPYCVVEVGIDGFGQMKKYASMIKPDIVVVTSIGSEHNRSLGTLEKTRDEKADMLRALPVTGLAVINGDDHNVRWMAGQTHAGVITFGFNEMNDVRAEDVILDWPNGMRFSLHSNGKESKVRTRLMGKEMVKCLLAAVALAQAQGLSLDQILSALEGMPPTPGRLEPIQLSNGAFVIADYYKSSLETIDAALDLLEQIPSKRRIVVLGEVSEPPGSQGPIYRRIGQRVGKIASRAIFVGGNYQRYAAGARKAGLRNEEIINAGRNIKRATEAVLSDLREGDVVLIKGRDNQRLDRTSHALEGRPVGCNIVCCDATLIRCEHCPMLERGWEGKRVII